MNINVIMVKCRFYSKNCDKSWCSIILFVNFYNLLLIYYDYIIMKIIYVEVT